MHTPITVHELDDAQSARWDAYVNQAAAASFFHLSGWRTVLQRAFGHRTRFLYAEQDGALCGVLPLAQVKSLLFGNSLVSTPFCVYGGIVADTPAAYAALRDRAVALAEELGVDHLELRNIEQREPDWPRKDLYVTFRRPIDPDPEQNMLEIPRKQRAMVRKGIKAGLESELEDGVENLYTAYSESVRNLGTPVFARAYLEILMEVFAGQIDVLTIRQDRTLVGSVMSFYFRDQVLPYYGGGTADARRVAGNDFMYWELMRRSAEKGLRLFDFGRSKQGTGSYHFKKNWGFEPEPLNYEYHLVKAGEMPDLNPLNPKYRLFIAAWKKLPMGVSRLIGPHLARSLG